MDDRTERNIQRVAELVAEADALLIAAGAGMGVDSGLPDLGDANEFWRVYPALRKLGISIEQLAQSKWFEEKPDLAWAFFGHRQQLYRETKPHDGYGMLLEWGRALPAGYFVVTSNVDGQFQMADFPTERIVELHGCIQRYQCAAPCCRLIWYYDHPGRPPQRPPDLKIDVGMMRAFGELPKCPECGGIARPNTFMFNDDRWLDDVRRIQQIRCQDWINEVRDKRVVAIQCGLGTAIDTLRPTVERMIEHAQTTLVTVDPAAAEDDESMLTLRMPVLEALTRIDEALPAIFKARGRAVSTSPARLRDFDEAEDSVPGRRRRYISQEISHIKFSKMVAPAFEVSLGCGGKAWVDKLNVQRNYDQFPLDVNLFLASHVAWAIEEVRKFVRTQFQGPEPVVIPPKVFDASSPAPILPQLRFAAQISSKERPTEEDDGSWMNLIWFAEIDDDKSIKRFVEEALAQVDWKRQAEGYSI